MAQEFELTPSFKRRLKKKPVDQQQAVMLTVALVAEGSQLPGLQIKQLQYSSQKVFSARIDRANRITFHREGDKIVFRNHCNHDAVYRMP